VFGFLLFCLIKLKNKQPRPLYISALMLYNSSMVKKTRRLSNLTVIVILALVLSSSFCLRLLSGLALAAEMSSVVVQQMTTPTMSVCEQSAPAPVASDQQISRTPSTADIPSCCLNQDHYLNAIASHGVAPDNLLLAVLPVASQVISAPLVSFNRQITFLPPPQAAELRSVVKRE
jgi:hypothetical protein